MSEPVQRSSPQANSGVSRLRCLVVVIIVSVNEAHEHMDAIEKKTLYDCVAHQINREDGLINNRLGWTLQLNGFLFAALALLRSDVDQHVRQFLQQVLPLAGAFISAAGLAGVVAANLSIRHFIKRWVRDLSEEDEKWPRPFGAEAAYSLGLLPSVVPPLILLCIWIYWRWSN